MSTKPIDSKSVNTVINAHWIAELCHEVKRQYCRAQGDMSRLPWSEAPEWQRRSAIAGVELHSEDSSATPADTHRIWMAEKERDGWTYGPVRDVAEKRHPCMVPFERLPRAQQAKSYIFRAIVHFMVHGRVE